MNAVLNGNWYIPVEKCYWLKKCRLHPHLCCLTSVAPHMDGEENTAPPLHSSLTDSSALCFSWGNRLDTCGLSLINWLLGRNPTLHRTFIKARANHRPQNAALRAPLQTFRVLSSMETRQNPRVGMLISAVHVAKSLKSAWENGKEWVQTSAGGLSNWTKGGTEERGGEAASGRVDLLWGIGGGRSGRLFQIRRQRSEDDKETYQETNLCSSAAEQPTELHRCARLFRPFLLLFQDFGLRSA